MPVEVDAVIKERFGSTTFSGAYGVTEASLVSWQPPGVDNRPNAAGVINDEYFDVRIFDDDDHELPRDTDGEIVLRPKRPHVMFEGYWGRPEATVGTSRNWWYHTGDIGRIDDDDYLYFVDRKADYLRRRGENISSFEVERILMGHGAAGRRGRARGAERADRGRPEDHGHAGRGRRARPRTSCSAGASTSCPTSRCPATSSSATSCPAARSAASSSASCATRASPPATWDAETSGITYEKR